ncbi:MAG: divergent PAP2 family protein [Dehalococcoidia bacterium]|nr:divergent PAP2 family protein [Dehalococcoidia bacterium]
MLIRAIYNSIINLTLIIPLVAWVSAQILKVVGGCLRERRWDWSFFIRSGGMPSAHTALVTSLATTIGFLEGFGSTLFGIAVVFALIVMYDAAGVRRAVGIQAGMLNRISHELWNRRPKGVELSVRELLGHTPVQVLSGAAVGIVVALIGLLIAGKLHA